METSPIKIHNSIYTQDERYGHFSPKRHNHGLLAKGKARNRGHYHKDGDIPHSHLKGNFSEQSTK